MRDKNKKKSDINEKLVRLKAIKNKTETDKCEIVRLENEAKRVEDDIIDTAKKYKDKLKKLHEKPKQSRDVSKFYDDMKKKLYV